VKEGWGGIPLKNKKKRGGGTPLPLPIFPIMLGELSGYKTLEMPQGFTPSFESVPCELLLVGVKMSRRRSLGCLCSFVNIHGEEAVGRRVRPERTHVERQAMRIAERREETWRRLNRQRMAAFIQMYLLAIVYNENAHRHPEGKRKSQKKLNEALVKQITPFIYRNRVGRWMRVCGPEHWRTFGN